MKKHLIVLILLISSQFSFGQNYHRKIIDYYKLSDQDSTICSELITEGISKVTALIDNLQSEKAVILANEIFNKTEKCPALFETYAWALFRSGEWIKSVFLIDSAITVYGAQPDLILKRAYINLEMAELGVGVRNIDGNSVYLSKDKKLNFDDSVFKKQNYLAALNDFKYIADNYRNRSQEIYITGYIYQILEEYENSNTYLSKLLSYDEYADEITLAMVDNYIGQKRYEDAENSLIKLEVKYPFKAKVQKKLSELYTITGNNEKLNTARLKAQFYSWVPEYCEMEYSEENYQLVSFFVNDMPAKQKVKKLKEIRKGDVNRAINLFITILNIHENHGNGIEEETAKMLIDIGDSVVPKVILLLNNAPSTCTVTNAASILADLKDPRGWQPLIDYLPRITNIPFTLIPPNVPEQIIKFDKQKGLVALLEWIKGQLAAEVNPSDNPLDELGGIFASTSIYSPLKVYKKEEVQKTAKELKYTDEQIEKLMKKIYD